MSMAQTYNFVGLAIINRGFGGSQIAGYAKGGPIKTYDLVLGADGKPRPELFVSDRLHFNAEGYKLLLARVRPQVAGK